MFQTMDSGFRRNDASFYFTSPTRVNVQSKKVLIQILPVRVHTLYQLQFPCALPFLDCLFPRNGRHHALMRLIPNQCMNSIFFGKTVHLIVFMFPYPFYEIRSYPCIKSPVPLTCKNINARLFRHRRSSVSPAKAGVQSLLSHSGFWLKNCRNDGKIILQFHHNLCLSITPAIKQ